ncbi:hypothetical protein [Pedobacter hiemivivus]|uniref:Uncharacterized protein n=1 Tax=Pedobacter hiemivivus TaxID=2530454 RepID=A0A4R0NG87_9SPHI|nr:hypothetical protein [Pedobacter hiemivivus]TCC99540.1 hypothetical protein EZ444_02365 [Pedobacter hiemivivus]
MIVEAMTLQEIHNELFTDLPTLNGKMNHCKKDFRRKVLKASRFPYTFTYELNTPIKKNLFIVTLTALTKGNSDKPLLSVYGIYDRPEGKYAAALSVDLITTSIYPPHFFKRYRERIVKDDKLANKQLIRLYFAKSWGFYKVVANKGHEAVYNSFENSTNEEISFIAATDEGYCFGSSFGKINIIKTIISEENLFDDQKELFHKLREDYNNANKDRYGVGFRLINPN